MDRKPTHPGTEQEPAGLEVLPGLVIPDAELTVQRTRSGGPGGQNVNKVNTRIELYFDVTASAVLDPQQKRCILSRLSTRISKEGVLRVTSQAERTQARNLVRARNRMAELLAAALHRRRPRRPTRPTRASTKRRVDTKKQRSVVKQRRRKPAPEE